MVNYNNGKVYKIVCDTTGLIYVGSTTKKYLSQRLDGHRSAYNSWKNGKTKKTLTSFKVLESNNYTIVLLEPFNCNSNDELKARERFYIESNVCVNKNIPTRTKKEYFQANKETFYERQKEYYQTNKEHLVERQKEYYQSNKEQFADKNKAWRVANKEQIAEKVKVTVTCECGNPFTYGNKARHFKSKKHLKYIDCISLEIK